MKRWRVLAPLIALGALVIFMILSTTATMTAATTETAPALDDLVIDATKTCEITGIAQERFDPITSTTQTPLAICKMTRPAAQSHKANTGMANIAAQTSRRYVLKMPFCITGDNLLNEMLDCTICGNRPANSSPAPRRCVLKVIHSSA